MVINNSIPSDEVYFAPIWLPGGNLQTIYATFVPQFTKFIFRRERWVTPDQDFIDLDWIDGEPDKPILVLFHGLEGSSRSHYVSSLINESTQYKWSVVVVHFRGCSGEPNRLSRAYHAGDAQEISWILNRFKANYPNHIIFASGVSLGGNALLKWLGETGAHATKLIRAAAAMSAPVDLLSAGYTLGKGFNLFYTSIFLRSLKKKSLQKLDSYPRLFDRDAVQQCKTLYEFDDLVTAPLHGFKGVEDYWMKAGAKSVLTGIMAPTLLINARNDPFLPETSLPTNNQVSKFVTLDFPKEGGHVGFVSGPFPGQLTWLPKRILNYFRTFN